MSHEPVITKHGPCFIPASAPNNSGKVDREVVAAASRKAAQRDLALMRALNSATPVVKPELVLRKPILREDYFEQATKLDEAIYRRGVAIDRDRLLELGREWFNQLLVADREARAFQRVIGTRRDLSSWPTVYLPFAQTGALSQIPVPPRKQYEQLYGINKEIDSIREVTGFVDLWKFGRAQPQAIQAITAFHDCFATLMLGQSMLKRISDYGRLRSRFFTGGHGAKAERFHQWLSAVDKGHTTIRFNNALQAAVFWLAGETSEPPDLLDLAREYSNTRVPSKADIKFAQAVLDGFLLNHKGWSLWQFVGRRTQALPYDQLLQICSGRLERRFRRVQFFHHEVEQCFWRPVGNHNELDLTAWRGFINRVVNDLRDCVSSLAALAVEESGATVTARFQNSLLCESEPNAQLVDAISEKLGAAFPRVAFKVTIEP
jgi:hypothetical protein